MKNMPHEEGFWWGQWKIAADGTPDGEYQTPSSEWEVMHVVENTLDKDDPEYLMAMVPGQSRWQPLENFYWGSQVFPPTSAKATVDQATPTEG